MGFLWDFYGISSESPNKVGRPNFTTDSVRSSPGTSGHRFLASPVIWQVHSISLVPVMACHKNPQDLKLQEHINNSGNFMVILNQSYFKSIVLIVYIYSSNITMVILF